MIWNDLKFSDVHKAALTLQQQDILSLLGESDAPVKDYKISKWLVAKGYINATRESVRVQLTHMRKKIKALDFEIASQRGRGGGLFLRAKT